MTRKVALQYGLESKGHSRIPPKLFSAIDSVWSYGPFVDELRAIHQVPWVRNPRGTSELKPEYVLSIDTSSISANPSTLQAKKGGGERCTPPPRPKIPRMHVGKAGEAGSGEAQELPDTQFSASHEASRAPG